MCSRSEKKKKAFRSADLLAVLFSAVLYIIIEDCI